MQNDPTKTNGRSRLALTRREAAEAFGVPADSFERHIQGELPAGPAR